MASSNNLASLEPWSFRSASFPDSWISDSFARETETFTKALQQSLSTTNTATITTHSYYDNNNGSIQPKTEQKPTGSVSDPDIYPKRRNTVANGKISKRKSRASKRSPTTFIAADPSNFRQMVQQVTGIQFGDPHMPVTSVLKPEPQRPGNGNRVIQSYSLPTLDTSAYLLDNNGNGLANRAHVGPTQEENPPVVVAEGGGGVGGSGFDFGSFQNFPTLESWRVM